jgi:hypothetical protein
MAMLSFCEVFAEGVGRRMKVFFGTDIAIVKQNDYFCNTFNH